MTEVTAKEMRLWSLYWEIKAEDSAEEEMMNPEAWAEQWQQ
jgi:hypothetical protein